MVNTKKLDSKLQNEKEKLKDLSGDTLKLRFKYRFQNIRTKYMRDGKKIPLPWDKYNFFIKFFKLKDEGKEYATKIEKHQALYGNFFDDPITDEPVPVEIPTPVDPENRGKGAVGLGKIGKGGRKVARKRASSPPRKRLPVARKKPPKSEPKTRRSGKALNKVSDDPMESESEKESDSECLKKKKELKDKLRMIQVKNNTIRSTVNDILQFL